MRLATFAVFLLLASIARAEAPKIAPDESLTVAKYVEAGAPASDREWTGADYQKLVGALREVAKDAPRKLPRFESENSDALMRRVVSPDNFRVLHDPNLSLNMRLSEAVTLSQATGALAMIYVEASNTGETFDRELVEIMALITKASVELWTLVDEMQATLTDEERASRAGALGTIRSGSAQVVSGILTSFGETDVYRPSELQRLATLLTPLLPALMQRLTPESSSEATVRLKKISSESEDESVAAALRKLLSAVEAAPSPGS